MEAAISARDTQEQEDGLAEALHELERFEREIIVTCSVPAHVILRHIAQHWSELYTAALAELQGGAAQVPWDAS